MKEKTNFGNFPPLLLLLLHKCRLNRGQLHFARKTHFEWQTPKIYQCFDEDHTPGLVMMIMHMPALGQMMMMMMVTMMMIMYMPGGQMGKKWRITTAHNGE